MRLDDRSRKYVQILNYVSRNLVWKGKAETFVCRIGQKFDVIHGRFPQNNPHPLLCHEKVCSL